MTDVLKVRHKESELRPGTWVRVKRGKYANDLAQVCVDKSYFCRVLQAV